MWKNNSLSIVISALFLLSLAGHSIAGWKAFNQRQRQHGAPAITYTEFVRSSDFGETVFENWESEFLQMTFYVVLTVFLYQRGSSESKRRDHKEDVEEDPEAHRDAPDAPAPVRRGGWRLALYKNSLSLAFLLLFAGSFAGHAVAGARKVDQRAIDYVRTPQFWYESFQNWQSEFLAVLAIVVLSIWLRQWGSPESKPVHAPHYETGAKVA